MKLGLETSIKAALCSGFLQSPTWVGVVCAVSGGGAAFCVPFCGVVLRVLLLLCVCGARVLRAAFAVLFWAEVN